MKNKIVIVITIILFFCFCSKSRAQDSLHVKIGFFFNPQGVIGLQNTEKLFSTITPTFFVTQFTKKTGGLNVMYNMTYNKFQLVYFNKFFPKINYYILINKNILTHGGYASTGITHAVADGRGSGFIEFGSTWNKWTPVIFTGLIIPFTLKIK